jgi:hypothetical protein
MSGSVYSERRSIVRTLSTAAWVAHNLGLAACFGGLLFGKVALNPSLSAIESEAERGKVLNTTWNRYNAINVAPSPQRPPPGSPGGWDSRARR